MENYEKYMKEALREASFAASEDEVPIGAVVVCQGRIIGKGHNMTERLSDPTAHAEMIAVTAATEAMGGKYLNDCTLYVTVEPCPMCAGALLHARVPRIVCGATDPVAGAMGSVWALHRHPVENTHTTVEFGCLERECRELLQAFFQSKRERL